MHATHTIEVSRVIKAPTAALWKRIVEHSETGTWIKQAQVTLAQLWAVRLPPDEVVVHAMHPGWADTPGVVRSLPTFHRVVGPLLRTPAEGADTLVWLAASDGAPLASTGGFWHDRRRRSPHRLRSTRRADTEAERDALWRWCCDRAGVEP